MCHMKLSFFYQDSRVSESFSVYHYNGLKQSNYNEKVRFRKLKSSPNNNQYAKLTVVTGKILETVFTKLLLKQFYSKGYLWNWKLSCAPEHIFGSVLDQLTNLHLFKLHVLNRAFSILIHEKWDLNCNEQWSHTNCNIYK